MSKIHYFQRYSQKENWITNSTLLLLNRLYITDIFKFREFFLNILSSHQIAPDFGVTFEQQIKHSNSTPDGFIRQKSIQILIETKLHDHYSIQQLTNHLDAFDEHVEEKILLGLSASKPNKKIAEQIYNEIKSNKKFHGIKFACTTYKTICESFTNVLTDTDYQLKSIIDDYYSLCFEENLIDSTESIMLTVTAGTSLEENLNFNIYYDPANRNNNLGFKYLGLYHNKSVIAVGELEKIVECYFINNELHIKNNVSISHSEKKRIIDIIQGTEYYDIAEDHKFYLVKKFHQTDFKKSSYGPMRGKQYFNLNDFFGDKIPESCDQIALLLQQKTWE